MAKKDKAQNSQGNLATPSRKVTAVHFGPTVPSQSACAGNQEPGGSRQAISRHQPQLQPTTTSMMEKGHQAVGAQQKRIT